MSKPARRIRGISDALDCRKRLPAGLGGLCGASHGCPVGVSVILRAVIIWALAASAFAALSWWQWGLAADRADRAEARVEALTQRLGDIRRDTERDRAIDDAPLGDLPDGWRVPE